MKIKQISCTQFAGMRDQNVVLEDGVNIIYGKNESGKSTLVNLLSRTLFQEARIDGRSDKGKVFRKLYFPSARKGKSISGDFIDGKISFEAGDGTYTLAKEWGTEPRCALSTPDGVIRDQKRIDEILRDVLLYGEGVYSDMLFSSQHNTDLSLRTILDAAQKTEAKQELTRTVSAAFAESGGVSVDAIEQAVADKIGKLAGKHWDSERSRPTPKSGRWVNGLGDVLTAYYQLEDAQQTVSDISKLELEADQRAEDYAAKEQQTLLAEDAYNQFNTCASRLAVLNERKSRLVNLHTEAKKYTGILTEWPRLTEALKKARTLQEEQKNRELLDQYEAAKAIQAELDALDPALMDAPRPAKEEIQAVKAAQRQIASLQNKLCGMNLIANLNMLGGDQIEIKSLRTGQVIDASDGRFAITEAVQIAVPGVMELQLAPADVDVSEVEAQIQSAQTKASGILQTYQAESAEALEDLALKIAESRQKRDTITSRLSALLGTASFQEIEAAAKRLSGPVRSRGEIEADIRAVCESGDTGRFIAAKGAVVEQYVNEYGSIDALREKADSTKLELSRVADAVNAAEDIPDQYRAITDPEGHLRRLKAAWDQARSEKESALSQKAAAAKALESFQDNIAGDPKESLENAKRTFEEQKALLAHWQHIAQVFAAQKELLASDPMQDIADSFARYLSIISDGRISSEFPEADKLNMNIYSQDRLLDYGKLSEGSKDAVSLAFRLAVLDHLFPEGGGVIVLDDPLTDMDSERISQSCALIGACSKRHQVIFLTCREEYLKALDGHIIRFQ